MKNKLRKKSILILLCAILIITGIYLDFHLNISSTSCFFAVQTEKIKKMPEGKPVNIQGKLQKYEDKLQYENFKQGNYTYKLYLEAIDYKKAGKKIYYGKYKHKAQINGGSDLLTENSFIVDDSNRNGIIKLAFSLPESMTYLYAVRCTIYDENGNTITSDYLNATYGA